MHLSEHSDHGVTTILFRSGKRDFTEIDSEKLKKLLLTVTGELQVSHEKHSEIIQNCAKDLLQQDPSKPSFAPKSDQLFLSLGATWIHDGYFKELNYFKSLGVKVMCLVYDLIPIRDAVFPKNAAARFEEYINNIANVADYAPAISRYVRRDFEDYLNDLNLRIPGGSGHRLPGGFNKPKLNSMPQWSNPYVLCVGSIEKRKNHLMLMRAWKRIIDELGSSNVPDLLIVGRLGWHTERFIEKMEVTEGLNGKIHLLTNNVTDDALQDLYLGAMFTVFPSLEEGWGLPVTESLNLGVPVIASNSSSIPEAGGEFAEYFNPNDLDELSSVLQNWITNPSLVKKRRSHISENYVPYTWGQFVDSIVSDAETLVKSDDVIPIVTCQVEYCLAPVSVYHGGETAGEFIEFLKSDRRMPLSRGTHNVRDRSKALLCIKNRNIVDTNDGGFITFTDREPSISLQFVLNHFGSHVLVVFLPSITGSITLEVTTSDRKVSQYLECTNGILAIDIESKQGSAIDVDIFVPSRNAALYSFVVLDQADADKLLVKLRNQNDFIGVHHGSGLTYNQALRVQEELHEEVTNRISVEVREHFHNSLSWKITSPIRYLHKSVKRVFKRTS